MKTAISIPDDLFAEAEGLAERLGLSRSEVFARALPTRKLRAVEAGLRLALAL